MNKRQKILTVVAVALVAVLGFVFSDDVRPDLTFYAGVMIFGTIVYSGLMFVLKKS